MSGPLKDILFIISILVSIVAWLLFSQNWAQALAVFLIGTVYGFSVSSEHIEDYPHRALALVEVAGMGFVYLIFAITGWYWWILGIFFFVLSGLVGGDIRQYLFWHQYRSRYQG